MCFVGDNESRPFTDALSQLSYSVGKKISFSNIICDIVLVLEVDLNLDAHFYLHQVPVSNFLVCLSFVRGFSQQLLRYQSN